MTPELIQYLESIRYKARLEHADETGVMSELEAHIEDKIHELTESGLTEAEALETCLGEMGNIKMVARQIYEAYSQGSWKQALLTSMPHLLFGLLFVLNWWHYPGWLSIVLILTLATTIYGWWHGKPTWVFSWLGYTLLPVLAVGIMLLYLPTIWSFLALLIYFPMALWWLFRIIVQTNKRDWLFSSLMLLPLPVIIGWYLAVSPSGRFTEDSLQRLDYFAPWIGLSFMALALTIAAFIRLRQRWIRVGLLTTSGLLTVALIVHYTAGRLNTLTFFGLVLVMWGVLLVPPLLECQLRTGRKISWRHRHLPAPKPE
ncbi:MAG TPA: permease prefix domain 1-containing protein [Dehalococcoidales bacterium]|nr:permease prefix domain 1-containing protein [Dehalococcoidales bacterium]